MWPLWLVEMLSHHIQKNSPGLLYIPAKYENSMLYSIGGIAKTKCGSGGAGGLASPIYKQASLAGRLITPLSMCDDVTHTHEYCMFYNYSKHTPFKQNEKGVSGKTFFLHLQQFSAMNLPLWFFKSIFPKTFQVKEHFLSQTHHKNQILYGKI